MLLNYLLKRKKIMLYAGAVITVFVSVMLLAFTLSYDAFYKGIFIENIDVSGLNKDKAIEYINSRVNDINRSEKIVLQYNDVTWKFDFNDVSIQLLTEPAVNEAYSIGRTGNVFQRVYDIISIRKSKRNIMSKVIFDENQLISILSGIKTEIERNERNAEVSYNQGTININKEGIGRILDVDENLKMLENNIVNRDFIPMNLIVNEKIPEIIYNDIKDIKDVLASFSTTFNLSDHNRSYNINLACRKIDGSIIMPDQVFSMNTALGPRTAENGYKEAPVIFKNELVKGTGGGVCQVTTTLYNAILRSKLEVVARTNHSLPLGYVGLGMDATIAEDYIDFKFKNSKDYPICVSSLVEGNNLKVLILGKKDSEEYTVKLKSIVIREYEPEGEDIVIDNNLPDNEKILIREGKKGYRVIVYRETYNEDGELISREKISEDAYKPVKPQFKVNENFQ